MNEQRFWSKVRRGTPDECWPWQAAFNKSYGAFYYQGRMRQAHIVAFILSNGFDPLDLVRHTCNNKACCNPAHLVEGNHQDNALDAVIAGTATGGPKGGNRGPFNGMSTLSELEVERIKWLGLYFGPTEIARMPEFKGRVSRQHVGSILNKKKRKDF